MVFVTKKKNQSSIGREVDEDDLQTVSTGSVVINQRCGRETIDFIGGEGEIDVIC